MHTLTGGCHSGAIGVELELTRAPEDYHPRACDCDFCCKHAAAWVSDPEGRLVIRAAQDGKASLYRQGSGQAALLLCGQCGVLVAVLYASGEHLYAAINARAIEGGAPFGSAQSVSPKTLSEKEKVERWQKLWFSNVILEGIDPTRAESTQA